MAEKINFSEMRKRTNKASKGMSKKDREQEKKEQDARYKPITFSLDEIKPRPGGDTRSLHLEHVLSLAESISVLGLLEPIVIDKSSHLLAGGHRLAACRLLNTDPKKRLKALQELGDNIPQNLLDSLQERIDDLQWSGPKDDLHLIPVRVMDFDATEDIDLALAIEAAENTQRKDYTAKEVFELYEKLIRAGYTDKRGKPKQGEKTAKPAVALVIGKSVRTVERMLLKAEEKEKAISQVEEIKHSLNSLSKAFEKFCKASEGFDESESTKKLLTYLAIPKFKKLLKKSQEEMESWQK